MSNTRRALKIAAVVIVMPLSFIMQIPNQKSFQEGGGHNTCMGAGNPSLLLGMKVPCDLVRHPKSCLQPETAGCTFFASSETISGVSMT